jgi:uncharacterized protein YdeI (YjbR/CyaY-like superfamily)
MPAPELARYKFADQESWRDWLAENHATTPGVWLHLARKGSGIASVTRAEALEHALCYGWIDGQAKGVDETSWLQKFTPRKQDSLWSVINRKKALELIESGHMQPAGLAAVEQARKNGRWDAAYEGPSKMTVPADLQAELDVRPEAAAFFASLNSANRYAILFRLQTSKKPETRATRLRKFVEMLVRGEKIHP